MTATLKKRTREPQEVRRSALIQAAITIIAEHGLSNVTSQKVAQEAGMTAAMVNFHFSGKTALLHDTLRHVADEFMAHFKKVEEAYKDKPKELLLTLIDTAFSPELSDYKKNAVWYAFYAESRSRQDYSRICSEHDKAYYEALYTPIAALCKNEDHNPDAHAVTLAVIGIIEHAGQSILLNPEYDRDASIKDCHNLLRSVFRNWN